MVTPEQAAYVAGAIDGEGHLGLSKERPDPGVGRVSARYAFRASIANTNKAWLEQIRQWFGGTIYQHRREGRGDNRRDAYDLRFRRSEVRALLAATMPYLLIKKRHAELLLTYFELAATRRATSRPRFPADPAIVAAQDAIYEELRSRNLRSGRTIKTIERTDAPCSVSGCERKHYGRGYCWIHYRKYIVRGGPAFYEKKCMSCGRDFVGRRSDTVYCSSQCADKMHYARNREAIKERVKAYKQRVRVVPTDSDGS